MIVFLKSIEFMFFCNACLISLKTVTISIESVTDKCKKKLLTKRAGLAEAYWDQSLYVFNKDSLWEIALLREGENLNTIIVNFFFAFLFEIYLLTL